VQVVEFASGKGLASGVLILVEDTDTFADSLGSVLVVTSDHDDADTGLAALGQGISNFHTWGVQHANDTNEGNVLFVLDK